MLLQFRHHQPLGRGGAEQDQLLLELGIQLLERRLQVFDQLGQALREFAHLPRAGGIAFSVTAHAAFLAGGLFGLLEVARAGHMAGAARGGDGRQLPGRGLAGKFGGQNVRCSLRSSRPALLFRHLAACVQW